MVEMAPEDVLGDAVAAALRAQYLDPPRHHHTVEHAGRVATVAAELGADRACLLAAWAHDVVYQPTRHDNEEASARWLVAQLPDDPDVDEAARLILVTDGHSPGPDDRQAQILCDADLSVLGADADDYARYREGVRQEYAHVPDMDWLLGRARVLRSLLDRPRLFRTEQAWVRWEAQARINLATELRDLTAAAAGEPGGDGARRR